ncbi:hypothetical protein CCUS01_05924 [Colletotrichum cuscutae]|uniref:Uncharacterized protein n=1 Tax=Colletotrichum cuscutae TaxID=1209917 RepID=A0AAI9Y1G3_9PEZI|nr:hypothetical protein CCUS01_05924 [Colletotrichum cuscutae]
MRLELSPLLKTVLARDRILPKPFFSFGTEGPAFAGLCFSRIDCENVGSLDGRICSLREGTIVFEGNEKSAYRFVTSVMRRWRCWYGPEAINWASIVGGYSEAGNKILRKTVFVLFLPEQESDHERTVQVVRNESAWEKGRRTGKQGKKCGKKWENKGREGLALVWFSLVTSIGGGGGGGGFWTLSLVFHSLFVRIHIPPLRAQALLSHYRWLCLFLLLQVASCVGPFTNANASSVPDFAAVLIHARCSAPHVDVHARCSMFSVCPVGRPVGQFGELDARCSDVSVSVSGIRTLSVRTGKRPGQRRGKAQKTYYVRSRNPPQKDQTAAKPNMDSNAVVTLKTHLAGKVVTGHSTVAPMAHEIHKWGGSSSCCVRGVRTYLATPDSPETHSSQPAPSIPSVSTGTGTLGTGDWDCDYDCDQGRRYVPPETHPSNNPQSIIHLRGSVGLDEEPARRTEDEGGAASGRMYILRTAYPSRWSLKTRPREAGGPDTFQLGRMSELFWVLRSGRPLTGNRKTGTNPGNPERGTTGLPRDSHGAGSCIWGESLSFSCSPSHGKPRNPNSLKVVFVPEPLPPLIVHTFKMCRVWNLADCIAWSRSFRSLKENDLSKDILVASAEKKQKHMYRYASHKQTNTHHPIPHRRPAHAPRNLQKGRKMARAIAHIQATSKQPRCTMEDWYPTKPTKPWITIAQTANRDMGLLLVFSLPIPDGKRAVKAKEENGRMGPEREEWEGRAGVEEKAGNQNLGSNEKKDKKKKKSDVATPSTRRNQEKRGDWKKKIKRDQTRQLRIVRSITDHLISPSPFNLRYVVHHLLPHPKVRIPIVRTGRTGVGRASLSLLFYLPAPAQIRSKVDARGRFPRRPVPRPISILVIRTYLVERYGTGYRNVLHFEDTGKPTPLPNKKGKKEANLHFFRCPSELFARHLFPPLVDNDTQEKPAPLRGLGPVLPKLERTKGKEGGGGGGLNYVPLPPSSFPLGARPMERDVGPSVPKEEYTVLRTCSYMYWGIVRKRGGQARTENR